MSPRYPCENKSRCPHAVLIGLRSDCSTPMGVAASTRPLCSASGGVAVVRVDRQPRASGRTSAFRGSGGPCRRCRSSSKGGIGLSRSRASTRLEGPVLRQQTERLVPFLSHAQRAIAGRRIRERVRGAASGGILSDRAAWRRSTGVGRSCVSGRLRSCWIFALARLMVVGMAFPTLLLTARWTVGATLRGGRAWRCRPRRTRWRPCCWRPGRSDR